MGNDNEAESVINTYSVEQVADLFKVDRQTITRWIKDGKLKAFKLEGSRKWLFDEKYILEQLNTK
jgi:excisionase family DNA binding protein